MVILSIILMLLSVVGLGIEVFKANENFSVLNSLFCMFGFFVGLAIHPSNNKKVNKIEYQIELINQDSVKIKSLSTGRTYYESPENIYKALDKDNL